MSASLSSMRGIRHTADIGRFDDGRLAEVCLNGRTVGTDTDTSAEDAAIVASIAFQAGLPVERAEPENRDGSESGVLGAVLDVVSDDSDDPP